MPNIHPVGFEGQARRQFGELANRVGALAIDLSAARSKESFKIGGTFLKAADASSLSANLDLYLNNYGGDAMPIKKSGGFRGLAFNEIIVSNTAQAGESITLIYVTESVTRDFEIFDNASDFTNVTLSKNTNTTDATGLLNATQSAVVAANASRGSVVVCGDSGNTEFLYAGPSASDTEGVPIGPGGFHTFNLSAAITIYSRTGAAANQRYYYYTTED